MKKYLLFLIFIGLKTQIDASNNNKKPCGKVHVVSFTYDGGIMASSSDGFIVKYPDGKEICHRTAAIYVSTTGCITSDLIKAAEKQPLRVAKHKQKQPLKTCSKQNKQAKTATKDNRKQKQSKQKQKS